VTNVAYEAKIKAFGWPELEGLFNEIKARTGTPGWEAGKALEYLVPRMFELDGATVRWPYSTKLSGQIVEQVDGAVTAGGLHCLLECKDEGSPINIEPIAKLRNQLLRRPSSTIGLLFSMSGYTAPAQVLASYLGAQTILLWHPEEIELAVTKGRIIPLLAAKFKACFEEGLHDINSASLMGIL
jgi:hypothetical protein